MDNEVLFKELVGSYCAPLIIIRQFKYARNKLKECVGKSGLELFKNAVDGNIKAKSFNFVDYNDVSSLLDNDLDQCLLDSLKNNDQLVSESLDYELESHFVNYSKWFRDWCLTLALALRVRRHKHYKIPIERNGVFMFIHQKDDLGALRDYIEKLSDLKLSIVYLSEEYPEEFIFLMSKYTVQYCIINTREEVVHSTQLKGLIQKFVDMCYERLEWNVELLQSSLKNVKISSKMLISVDSEKHLANISLLMSEELALSRNGMIHNVMKSNLDHEVQALAEIIYALWLYRYGVDNINEYNQILNQTEETDRSTGYSVISHFDKAIAHFNRHNCVSESFLTAIFSLLIGNNEELNKLLATNSVLELSSKSDYARSALCLELSSIRCPKFKRKNFQLVMAGHLFNQASLESLSKRCYLACIDEYEGWDVAKEHLYSLLGNFDSRFIVNCLNLLSNSYENRYSFQHTSESYQVFSLSHSKLFRDGRQQPVHSQADQPQSEHVREADQAQSDPFDEFKLAAETERPGVTELDNQQGKDENVTKVQFIENNRQEEPQKIVDRDLEDAADPRVSRDGADQVVNSDKEIYYLKKLIRLNSFQNNSKYQLSTPISGAFLNYPTIYYVYHYLPKVEGVTPFLVRVPIIYLRKNGIIGTNVKITTCYVDDVYQKLLENSFKDATWQKCMKFYNIKDHVKRDFFSASSKVKDANYMANTRLNLSIQLLNPLNVPLDCSSFKILLEVLASSNSRNSSIARASTTNSAGLSTSIIGNINDSINASTDRSNITSSALSSTNSVSVDEKQSTSELSGPSVPEDKLKSPKSNGEGSVEVDGERSGHTSGNYRGAQHPDDEKYKWVECEILSHQKNETFQMEPFEKKDLVLTFNANEVGSFKIIGLCWKLFDRVYFWSPVYTVGKKLTNCESFIKLTLNEFVAQRAIDKTLYFKVYEDKPRFHYRFRKVSDLSHLKDAIFFTKKDLEYVNYDNQLAFYTEKYAKITSELGSDGGDLDNENLFLFECLHCELGLIEISLQNLENNPIKSIVLRFKALGAFKVPPYPVAYKLHTIDAGLLKDGQDTHDANRGMLIDSLDNNDASGVRNGSLKEMAPDGRSNGRDDSVERAPIECTWNVVNFPSVKVKEDSLTEKMYEVYMKLKDEKVTLYGHSLSIYLFVEPIKFLDGIALVDGSLSLVPKSGLDVLLPFKLFLKVKTGPEFSGYFDYKNSVKLQVNNKSREDIINLDFAVNNKPVKSTQPASTVVDDVFKTAPTPLNSIDDSLPLPDLPVESHFSSLMKPTDSLESGDVTYSLTRRSLDESINDSHKSVDESPNGLDGAVDSTTKSYVDEVDATGVQFNMPYGLDAVHSAYRPVKYNVKASEFLKVPSKSSMNFVLNIENPINTLVDKRNKSQEKFRFTVFWMTSKRFGICKGNVEYSKYKLTVRVWSAQHELKFTPEPVVVTLRLTLQNVSTESIRSLSVSAIHEYESMFSFIGVTKRNVNVIYPGKSVNLDFSILMALPGVYNFSPTNFKLVSSLDEKHVYYQDNVTTIILYE